MNGLTGGHIIRRANQPRPTALYITANAGTPRWTCQSKRSVTWRSATTHSSTYSPNCKQDDSFYTLQQGISDTGNLPEMSKKKQVDSSLLYLPYQSHASPPWPSHSWFPCIFRHRSLAGRYRWSQLSLASSSAGTGGTGSPSHILDKVRRTAPAKAAKIGHNCTQVFKWCVFNNATLKTICSELRWPSKFVKQPW